MALVDRLKYDFPPGVLVYRFPKDDLSLGAQLVVNESQEVLFYKGGQALDLFGPGTHTLSTANLPLLRTLINLPFGGQSPFTAEVYFVNKAHAFAMDWGTKTPIMLLDPKYKVTIPLRGYGQYAVHVENARAFVSQVVGSSSSAAASTASSEILASPIVGCVQQAFGDYLVKKHISALDLPAHSLEVASHALGLLREHFKTFGISVVNFAIESINFDHADESVRRLRSILDEAARLDVVGDAFRRNHDYYRTERQFDVLQGAAESGGPTGNIMGAALGIGLGFGAAGPTAELAKQAMAPASEGSQRCPACASPSKPGAKFCNECGAKIPPLGGGCPKCAKQNGEGAKFCAFCGESLAPDICKGCAATLDARARFCANCGERRGDA